MTTKRPSLRIGTRVQTPDGPGYVFSRSQRVRRGERIVTCLVKFPNGGLYPYRVESLEKIG